LLVALGLGQLAGDLGELLGIGVGGEGVEVLKEEEGGVLEVALERLGVVGEVGEGVSEL
jgi:hypothetical protein